MRQGGGWLGYTVLVMATLLLAACSPDYESTAARRVDYAQNNKGYIEFAAIKDAGSDGFINGVLQAVDEINAAPEKLLGRALKVHIESESSSFDTTKPTIDRIVSNPRITAVLGHRKSAIAIPASAIYERSEIIFMPPASTDTKLTGHDFQYVFRMFPSNTIIANQMANAAKTLGYQKIAILYARDDLSRELAFLFEDAALKLDIKLVHRASFFEDQESHHATIAQFSGKPLDAIFIASAAKPAGYLVRQLREMGVMKPVMGRHSLNSPDYIKFAGAAAENTIAPNVFPHEQKNTRALEFVGRYSKRYGTDPDYNAAQGYDSVMLLASVVRRANSTLPSQLATTLHFLPATVGVSGLHGFDASGDLLGKKYSFEVWQGGQWHLLPALQIPYLVSRFEKDLREAWDKTPKTDFEKIFSQRLHDDDHKTYLLDLAQEILQFRRIGIIYENTEIGRKAADYDILKTMVDRKGLEILGCEIAFSALTPKETEQALVACYGKLSLHADAFFIPNYQSINPKLLQRLNRSLIFYNIPSISLDPRNTDPSISLVLSKRLDVGQQQMQVYSGLLNNLKVHEFADHLRGMPELSVNLNNLQRFGRPDKPILDLSPDTFLNFSDSALEGAAKR